MSSVDNKLAAIQRRLDNPNPMDANPIPMDFDPAGSALFNVAADKVGRLWAYDHDAKELRMIYDPRDSRC
jgi:hypothetical protein